MEAIVDTFGSGDNKLKIESFLCLSIVLYI
jgi:hypothetical protein